MTATRTHQTLRPVTHRDPAALREHKLLRHLPPVDEDDPLLAGICDSVLEQGIVDAIKITKAGEIIDGRHRWRAARRAQMKQIPCIVVPDSEINRVALESMTLRQHYTKGQRAWWAVSGGMLDAAFAEARQRELAGKSNPPHSVRRVPSIEEFATQLELSVRLIEQARELRDLFHKHPEKRTFTDPETGQKVHGLTFEQHFVRAIMHPENPKGLGAIKAGIVSLLDAEQHPHKKTGGRAKKVERQLELFTEATQDVVTRWADWRKFDDTTQRAYWTAVKTEAAKLDGKTNAELAEHFLQLHKEHKAAAERAKED